MNLGIGPFKKSHGKTFYKTNVITLSFARFQNFHLGSLQKASCPSILMELLPSHVFGFPFEVNDYNVSLN